MRHGEERYDKNIHIQLVYRIHLLKRKDLSCARLASAFAHHSRPLDVHIVLSQTHVTHHCSPECGRCDMFAYARTPGLVRTTQKATVNARYNVCNLRVFVSTSLFVCLRKCVSVYVYEIYV